MNISEMLERVIEAEKPRSVLDISIGNNTFESYFKKMSPEKLVLDRIDINTLNALKDVDALKTYDVIFISGLLENLLPNESFDILAKLEKKVAKQIFVITPEYPNDYKTGKKSPVRAYHPIAFLNFDFAYTMLDGMQVFQIFPKRDYTPMKMDIMPEDYERGQKLRIAYVLTHKNLTGGLKQCFHQMRELHKRGHYIRAILLSSDNTAKRVIPDWCELTDDDLSEQIVIPYNSNAMNRVLSGNDIVIFSFNIFDKNSFVSLPNVPVVLWEQGDEKIYGDYRQLMTSNDPVLQKMHESYRLPVYMLAVSDTIKTVLKQRYNRETQYFPACIDVDFYTPAENKNNDIPVILLVGNVYLPFKNFNFAITVLEETWKAGLRFKVQWACQQQFDIKTRFPLEMFFSPSQEKLADLYRNSDIFVSTSLYESFALPPIEAMASGTAVIAADCGGINSYALPGENCLLAEQGDLQSMIAAIAYLIENPDMRNLLAKEGRKTALEYSFGKTAVRLEECLYKIISAHKILKKNNTTLKTRKSANANKKTNKIQNIVQKQHLSNPLVSIVVPVYNGENFLREAIDSALAQTYPNCEIVVINDGSTDNTEQICLDYGDKIRYYKKENGGAPSALNLGLEKMNGEYFSWLSHDDVYMPWKIESQISKLKIKGDMRKIVISDFEYLHQSTGEKTPVILNKIASPEQITNTVFSVVNNLIAGCALLIHRSHFERVGFFDISLPYTTDYDLWFRMFRRQKLVYCNRISYSARSHDKQDSKTKAIACREAEATLFLSYVTALTETEILKLYPNKLAFLLHIQQKLSNYNMASKQLNDMIDLLKTN